MTGELFKNFQGVEISPLSKILAVEASDIANRSAIKVWDAVVTIILQWLAGCPVGRNLKILICLS